MDRYLHCIYLLVASLWLVEKCASCTDLLSALTVLGAFGGFILATTALGWVSLSASLIGRENAGVTSVLFFVHVAVASVVLGVHAHQDFWRLLEADPEAVSTTVVLAAVSWFRLLWRAGNLCICRIRTGRTAPKSGLGKPASGQDISLQNGERRQPGTQ